MNLVSTVYESWRTTGFAWEQYDPESGQGQRTQHFTGWTSLVVKMMAMPDLSGGSAAGPPKASEEQKPVVVEDAPAGGDAAGDDHLKDEL